MQAVSAQPVEKGKWEILERVSSQTVVATGVLVSLALPVARKLGAGLVNARTIQPLDYEMLEQIRRASKRVIVMEEGVDCLGMRLAAELSPIPVVRMNVPCASIAQASVSHQRVCCGLTAEALEAKLLEKST